MHIRSKACRRVALGLSVVGALGFALARADAAEGAAPEPPAAASPPDHRAPVPEEPGPDAIGAMSVGHPHEGFLINGVPMPKSPRWLLADPGGAWGTAETVRALMHCIDRVFAEYPDSPPAIVGSLSKPKGGAYLPHRSHQNGRDADVYLWLKNRGKQWYVRGTPENLDRARTWAFIRAVITETDVEYILLDRSLHPALEYYALSHESDAEWVHGLFHDQGGQRRALVRHIPGHTGHMHVRFYNPVAQARGRHAYDRLVAQGHVQLRTRGVSHTVSPDETLSEIAIEYGTDVEKLRKLNDLDSDRIRVGQTLKVEQQIDLRGARDPIVIPPRRLPRETVAARTASLRESTQPRLARLPAPRQVARPVP